MMREDGAVKYITVQWYHPGGGGVFKGWHGIGEGFWMPEYQQGRRLPYRSEAEHWKARERMKDGSEGWTYQQEAERALHDCRRIFGEKQWRIVRVTVTQQTEEVGLAYIDC
jgi:hypothetical protein